MCVYIYIYMHVYKYMCVCKHIYICMHISTCIYVYIYTYTHTLMYIYIYIYMYVYIHECVCVCIYIYIYIHGCLDIYIYIYIVTRKYDTRILLPNCGGRKPATNFGSKQESVDDSSKQNNGKKGRLSLPPSLSLQGDMGVGRASLSISHARVSGEVNFQP